MWLSRFYLFHSHKDKSKGWQTTSLIRKIGLTSVVADENVQFNYSLTWWLLLNLQAAQVLSFIKFHRNKTMCGSWHDLDQIKQTVGVIAPSGLVEYHHFYYSPSLYLITYRPQKGVFLSASHLQYMLGSDTHCKNSIYTMAFYQVWQAWAVEVFVPVVKRYSRACSGINAPTLGGGCSRMRSNFQKFRGRAGNHGLA